MLAVVPIGIPRTSMEIQRCSLANGDSKKEFPFYIPIFIPSRFKKTGKRNEIFLATKFGITNDPKRPANGDPEYVKESMEKSLDRLGGMYLT